MTAREYGNAGIRQPQVREFVGWVYLDSIGRTVRATGLATSVAARADALTLLPNGIRALRSSDDAKLQALIAKALTTEPGHIHALSLPRRHGGADYLLIISRVRPPIDGLSVMILDRDSNFVLPDSLLSELFGLTPAEAKLAARLGTGESITEAAEILGIRASTARIHLTTIYRKTATTRLSGLARLLCSVSASVEIQQMRSRFLIDGGFYNLRGCDA